MKVFLLLALTVLVIGCTLEENETKDEFIDCPEDLKGAKYCTMDYDPVCGEDGETYSNVCVACGSVDRYVIGECP